MVSSCVEESKEIEEKELEMCHLWVERDFSNIPVALIEKAYKDDWYDAIEILAPTFEDYKERYREEHQCEIECDECTDEVCRDAYEEWYFNEIHNAWFVRNEWRHLWRFPSKKEALKFAINWMREHPNG